MKQLIFIALCSCSLLLKGQDIANLEATLPSKDLRVDSVFAILRAQHNLVFSYSNSLQTGTVVHFDKTTLTVLEIIKTLSSQTEMNYKIQGRKILLFSKKKKHYISGIIKDNANGEILPGTSIRLKGTNYGVSANEKGFYQLRLEEGNYVLSFSSIGYEIEDKEISVFGDTEVNVALKISTSPIDEVKVTKQRNFWRNLDVGRNISSLDSKKIETLNTNNAADILQASMPGVWSTQSSGAPGDHQKVKIRGINSIFGCTDPLYIIDGVAVPIVNLHSLGIADLNIHDIESITVLKDASSNAIYGYQGGNGVIIIDTKRGGNENHISFSTKYGIQRVPRKYDLMNTKDFLTALDSAKRNYLMQNRNFYPQYSDTLKSTDWQDVVFQDGILKEYQLSGSGKIGNTNVYLSGNYYTHEGIIVNSNYKKYSLSANISRNITKKLSIELNTRNSIQKNKNNMDTYNGNDIIIEGINKSPLFYSTADSFYESPLPYLAKKLEVYPQKLPRTYYNYYLVNGMSKTPTDSLLKFNNNTLETKSNTFELRAKYMLADNFIINAASSVSYRNNIFQSDNKASPFSYNTNKYMKSNENYLLLNQQINLNYQKFIGRNEFQITSGYRGYLDNATWKLDSTANSNYINNFFKNSLIINSEHGATIRDIQSLSAVLNYNFSKKYFLSLIGNYEQLTVAKTMHYASFYPSISASWDLSHEYLLNQLAWLNELSVFANWGRVGNMPINALATDMYKEYRYKYGDSLLNGRAVEQFSNHYMKPEIITESNLGIKFGLLQDRIRFSADYYTKQSENLIMIRDIPNYYGSGRMMINIAKVTNLGKEMSIEMDVVATNSFQWTTSFAISTNKLRVKEIGEVKRMDFYNNDDLMPQFEIKPDEELGIIKGYQYIGKWTDEDKEANNILYTNSGGDKYLNYDTINRSLDEKDMVKIGKTMPDYTFHWLNTFAYKNFSLDMLWYGVKGVDKFNATKASTYMAGTNREVNQFLTYKYYGLYGNTVYHSSYFVEDASFVRLKHITLSYNFPKKIFNKANLKVSLSFENLITLTKYTGYDPEATIYTDNTFSDYAVDRGAYPNPKSIYFTLLLDL